MDAQGCGVAASMLGAGREKKEDAIDYGAGIWFEKKVGDFLHQGDTIAHLYAGSVGKLDEGEEAFYSAMEISKQPPQPRPMILDRVE